MTTVKVAAQLYGDEAWKLYFDAFANIDTLAVQRRMMYRWEFDVVMQDRYVHKFMARGDSDVLCGLSTLTNYLDSMPLISPSYFKHRWPSLYSQRRIYYCGFIGVAPYITRPETFTDLVEAMYAVAYNNDALICLDLCNFDGKTRNMEQTLPLMMRRVDRGVETSLLDQQTYYVYVPSTVDPA